MNQYVSIIIMAIFYSCSPTVIRNDATIIFINEKCYFGTLHYKKVAEYSFQFINPGKTLLVISDVKTSCGCTVPEWPKTPIRPGEKGKIKIKYDAAYPGMFHKTVEVFYNGAGSPHTLDIKGEVEYPKENQ